jgi:hypothetical protein
MNAKLQVIILSILLCAIAANAFAQNSEDWLWEDSEQTPQEEELVADFIKVNYDKKDARLAMLMSMVVPGSGQFYADKSSFTTYLFPAIEIGMVAGILYFTNQGNEKTKDFEHYANQELVEYALPNGELIETYRYDRDRQHRVEGILKGLNSVDIYEDSYFRLDDSNTQHFYEDIGKYPHYVFGWADWYYTFASDEDGNFVSPQWAPSGYDANPPDPGWVWSGNYPIYDDPEQGLSTNQIVSNNTHQSSAMRERYVDMRNEAKSEYSTARLFTFGLAINHIAAGLDAIRVTRKINRGAITDNGLRFKYFTAIRNNHLTPSLSLNWKF